MLFVVVVIVVYIIFQYSQIITYKHTGICACFVYRQRALFTLYVIDRHNLSKLQYYEYNILQYLYIYIFNNIGYSSQAQVSNSV